jgi:hypothetical protein
MINRKEKNTWVTMFQDWINFDSQRKSALAMIYRTKQNSGNINVFYAIISYNTKMDKILMSFTPIVQKTSF